MKNEKRLNVFLLYWNLDNFIRMGNEQRALHVIVYYRILWREAVVCYHSDGQSRASMQDNIQQLPRLSLYNNCRLRSWRNKSIPEAMEKGHTRYAFQTISGLMLLEDRDIVLFRFQDNNWQMTLADKSVHTLRPHTTSEKLLSISQRFVKVRQECIINLDYLVFIENKTLRCIFRPPFDDIEVVISRRCYVQMREYCN